MHAGLARTICGRALATRDARALGTARPPAGGESGGVGAAPPSDAGGGGGGGGGAAAAAATASFDALQCETGVRTMSSQ